jgi:hypothetical protein
MITCALFHLTDLISLQLKEMNSRRLCCVCERVEVYETKNLVRKKEGNMKKEEQDSRVRICFLQAKAVPAFHLVALHITVFILSVSA